MESPLMNAGGLVKSVKDVRLMAETPVGAVLAGSYTLEPRVGNSPNGEQVYYHDGITGITYNALGMPNKGLREVAKELPEMIKIAHDNGKPFILNLAPVSTDPLSEIVEMGKVLEEAGIDNLDGIELNASCPNVVTADGGRHSLLSHSPGLLQQVAFELSDIGANEVPFGTLLVRISPLLAEEDARKLVISLQQSGVNVISAFNGFGGGTPLDEQGNPRLQVPGGIGGKSGSGMSSQAEKQTAWLVAARNDTKANLEIIGSNGVTNAETMKRRLDLGVAAVGATTLFWESRRWGEAASKLLEDFAQL